MRRAPRALALVLVAALVVGCGAEPASTVPAGSAASAGRLTAQRALIARNIELQPADLTAPAGIDILIAFDNLDQGVPHGLTLYADAAHTITLGSAPIEVGPIRQSIQFAGLAPGRYQFSCVVHPNMTADLVVRS